MSHPLDNASYYSLIGPHARFALRRGDVRRYQPDVAIFTGMPDDPTDADWRDAAALVGPDVLVRLSGRERVPPDGWETVSSGEGVQMTGEDVDSVPDPEAVRLTAADVPEMLDLVARTKPGPFFTRTIEMGTYLGIRRDGALVAMAGERLHPPGWTEISAVCTDEAWRGHGFATRLMRAVAAVIRDHGDTPFLHAAAVNTGAIDLYEAIGFRLRRKTVFFSVRPPNIDPVDVNVPLAPLFLA
jgi:predicted GNAT family acetyltransferase